MQNYKTLVAMVLVGNCECGMESAVALENKLEENPKGFPFEHSPAPPKTFIAPSNDYAIKDEDELDLTAPFTGKAFKSQYSGPQIRNNSRKYLPSNFRGYYFGRGKRNNPNYFNR